MVLVDVLLDDNGDAEICVVERLHLSMSGDSEHSDEVGWLARRMDERVVLDDDDAVSIRRSAMVVLCFVCVMLLCGRSRPRQERAKIMMMESIVWPAGQAENGKYPC